MVEIDVKVKDLGLSIKLLIGLEWLLRAMERRVGACINVESIGNDLHSR